MPKIFEKYKRLIIMLAFIIAISWTLAGTDFFGENTRLIISGVCGAGLLVFLMFYKDGEGKPELTTRPTIPLRESAPPRRTEEKSWVSVQPTSAAEVSKVIDEAHIKAKQEEDIFRRFK